MSLLIAFLILIASFPTGYILRYLTKEELKAGKKYFKSVCTISLVLAIGFLFLPLNNLVYKQTIIFSLLFMANVAFISWK